MGDNEFWIAAHFNLRKLKKGLSKQYLKLSDKRKYEHVNFHVPSQTPPPRPIFLIQSEIQHFLMSTLHWFYKSTRSMIDNINCDNTGKKIKML